MSFGTLRYEEYVAAVEIDAEEGLLRGKVLNMADHIHFEGRSVEELREDFAAQVGFYREICKKRGLDPKKSYSGKFQVRVAANVHRKCQEAAAGKGKSLNAWIADVLEKAAG